ncbi:MAG: fimbrillin family protein [Parabacteroides sp.]|nr:fimbrillin family protein [Parabacteroides sp.]
MAATVLGGCSKSDELTANSNFPADGVIRVATSVGDMQTRAGITTENISTFQLKIEHPTHSDYSYCAYMEGSNTDGWGSYSAVDGTTALQMLWRNNTDKVKVTAVSDEGMLYTNDDFTNGHIVSIADYQTEKSWFMRSDVLFMATKEVDPAKDLTADGKLPITFKHLFSKLNLTITLGTELNITPGTATNPISELKVNGTYTGALFAPLTDVLTLDKFIGIASILPLAGAYTPGSTADAAPQTKAVAPYECILVPQTVATGVFTISFTIGDKPYEWVSTNEVTLVSGNQYALNLTVGKDAVQVGQFTASEWTGNTNSPIETE